MLACVSLRRVVFLSAAALVAATAISLTAPAQDASASVRAARLTSSQGTVTVVDGANPAVPAQMNAPLPAGVQIATGDDGQAEIEFEDGSVARLTPNSTISLDRLDVAPGNVFVTGLSLIRGLAYFELRATPEYTYSVSAGGDVVSPVENATIRVNFDQPPASFAVLDGSAAVERANSFQATVNAGETLSTDGGNPSRYFLTQQIASDSWDQWNEDMDQQEAQQASDSTSVRDDYAGAQGYGWGDLDADGTWYDVPGQGQVWQPYAAEDDSGFDPYGDGSWVWYPGTGYLWASAYPWGWTPYRCGAWSYYNSFGWGWAPGATCGGFGWGFAGGGFPVNVGIGPRGYRPVHVPIARPGPVRPVIPARIAGAPGQKFDHVMPPAERRARQIAGVTATPIAPAHTTFVAGRAGTALHRDFPIDRATHAPAMGATSARGTTVYHIGQQPQGGQQQMQGQQRYTPRGDGSQSPQTNQPAPQEGFQGQRTRGLQPRGATQNGPSPQPGQQPAYVRPRQQNAPQQTQHTEPAHPMYQPAPSQPQQQRYTPPQNTQRQMYTPPQAQHTEPAHPTYTPPPQQRQSFSPPPQEQRYSPPPPPPPAPHMSAPPPSTSNSAPSHR